LSIITQQEKLIIKFLFGVCILGIVVTGYRHWFGESVPSTGKEIMTFKSAAMVVAEEKEKILMKTDRLNY
jgi:hypothetical protein